MLKSRRNHKVMTLSEGSVKTAAQACTIPEPAAILWLSSFWSRPWMTQITKLLSLNLWGWWSLIHPEAYLWAPEDQLDSHVHWEFITVGANDYIYTYAKRSEANVCCRLELRREQCCAIMKLAFCILYMCISILGAGTVAPEPKLLVWSPLNLHDMPLRSSKENRI